MAQGREIDFRYRDVTRDSKVNPGCRIAGLILAGGASRRMGSPKALLRFQGETFLDRMIGLFGRVCDPVIVVLGHNAQTIRASIERTSGAVFALNPDPERGMLSSLQSGCAVLPSNADGVMFAPVDHPHLRSSTLETLAARFRESRAPVTVPVYGGEHGHPVCISRALADEIRALPLTAMASDVVHRYVEQTCYFDVDDPAVVTDIDDPAAYAELLTGQGAPQQS